MAPFRSSTAKRGRGTDRRSRLVEGAQPPQRPMALDPERDRLSGRVARFARVGAGLSGAAATIGANAILGGGDLDARNARAVKAALGQLKGPLMKIAQMATTVPDLLPPEFAQELASLQMNAPPMAPSFVRRRMMAELGADWQGRFASFDLQPAAAASLGQVHRAIAPDGRALAVKLQYPDMQSAVESDLAQMRTVMAIGRQMFGAVDTREIAAEISERIREELDYEREAKAMRLYGAFFAGRDDIAAPEPLPELSTGRLLTMTWLDGRGLPARSWSAAGRWKARPPVRARRCRRGRRRSRRRAPWPWPRGRSRAPRGCAR